MHDWVRRTSEAGTRAIEAGDRVAYSKQWLRSTGQMTGDSPQARGTVTEVEELGSLPLAVILFLRKRSAVQPANHVDADWLAVAPLSIDGMDIPINRYFLNHPEMVLGNWTRTDTLYGGE